MIRRKENSLSKHHRRFFLPRKAYKFQRSIQATNVFGLKRRWRPHLATFEQNDHGRYGHLGNAIMMLPGVNSRLQFVDGHFANCNCYVCLERSERGVVRCYTYHTRWPRHQLPLSVEWVVARRSGQHGPVQPAGQQRVRHSNLPGRPLAGEVSVLLVICSSSVLQQRWCQLQRRHPPHSGGSIVRLLPGFPLEVEPPYGIPLLIALPHLHCYRLPLWDERVWSSQCIYVPVKTSPMFFQSFGVSYSASLSTNQRSGSYLYITLSFSDPCFCCSKMPLVI